MCGVLRSSRLQLSKYFIDPINYVFGIVFVFLAVNLSLRFYAGFHYLDVMLSGHSVRLYDVLTTGIVVLSAAGLIGIVWFSRYLKAMLFVFGLSFALFGFQPYTPYSQLFETIVTFGALALLIINFKDRCLHVGNRRLLLLLLLYVSLSGLSLVQLPLVRAFKGFELWGASWSFLVFGAVPAWYVYAIAGVNKLVLFVIFIILLSGLEGNRGLYRAVFLGALWGAVISAIVGLLDYYGVISLTWFRSFNPNINPGGIQFRLQSIFGHPGWFAEFVTITIPFILMGFVKKDSGVYWKIFLFGVLLLCEIALILAKARAGWIAYPVTLVFCWVLFYLFKEKDGVTNWQINRKGLIKVAISVPVTIVLSLLIIFKLLGGASYSLKATVENPVAGKSAESRYPQQSIGNRAKIIFRASDRTVGWKQGFDVGMERPVFGMGYESFRWHKEVLENVEKSHIRRNGSHALSLDTPHNLFVQLFVNGGFAGLFLWGLVVAYVLALLIADLLRNKRYFNVCVALSIVSFHVYGVFQSMQYIPMIWFLIFLMFGYALTIDDGVLPVRVRKLGGVFTKISVVLVVIGGIVYLSNFESRGLAEKYGLEVYRKDQDRNRYYGFHPRLDGNYRWSGKRAAVDVPGGGQIDVDFKCETAGLEKDPVVVMVFIDGKILDKISFSKKGTVRRKYHLPETPGKKQELLIEVSRTWIPHEHLGNFDRRKLGVGVRLTTNDTNMHE